MADAAKFVWGDGSELTFAESFQVVVPPGGFLIDQDQNGLAGDARAGQGRRRTNIAAFGLDDIPMIDDVGARLESFAGGIKHVADAMKDAIAPDEFTLEVGFTASYKAGFILWAGEGEASMKATLKWKKPEPSVGSTGPEPTT